MDDVLVRRVVPEDAGAWADLRSQLWTSPHDHAADIRRYFSASSNRGQVYVAVAGEVLVGFIETTIDPSSPAGAISPSALARVEGWFVLSDFRCCGVGRALMNAAASWAQEQGAQVLLSECDAANHISKAAHESLGYEVLSKRIFFRLDLTSFAANQSNRAANQ